MSLDARRMQICMVKRNAVSNVIVITTMGTFCPREKKCGETHHRAPSLPGCWFVGLPCGGWIWVGRALIMRSKLFTSVAKQYTRNNVKNAHKQLETFISPIY